MFLRWGLHPDYRVTSLTKTDVREPSIFDLSDSEEESKRPAPLTLRSVKLKHLSPLKLRLFDLRSPSDRLMTCEETPSFASINVLKSNLQKCIRRNKKAKGLRTARRWLRCDPSSFLRRWPIILIEDATLDPSFPALIWLMVAVTSFDYLLTEDDEEFILKSVIGAFSHSSMMEIVKVDLKSCPPVQNPRSILSMDPMVQALWIRLAYGGMAGDLRMIAGLASGDHLRISRPSSFCDFLGELYRPLVPTDILEVSRDFHVYPVICETIGGSLGKDPAKVKSAIWAHASGVIHRSSTDGKVLERETRLAALQAETREMWDEIQAKGLYKI